MSPGRRTRILGELAEGRSLCEVSRFVTGVTGAGITLIADGRPWGSLCTDGLLSARIEDLQYTLGEGPCVDACRLERPVLEPDLAAPTERRWPAFTGLALEAGARAVFGFPLRTGGAPLGALNLCMDVAGVLSDEQLADALVMADVAGEALLAMQAAAPPGSLAPRIEESAHLRIVVHQAAGMLSYRLGVSVADAMSRLRAHAFAHSRRLDDLAADVVGRRLDLDDPPDPG